MLDATEFITQEMTRAMLRESPEMGRVGDPEALTFGVDAAIDRLCAMLCITRNQLAAHILPELPADKR